MSRVWTYQTEIGLRDLCAECVLIGDHGCGEIQDYRSGEHRGICAGKAHQDGARQPRRFRPSDVCTWRIPSHGLIAGVAVEILKGEKGT